MPIPKIIHFIWLGQTLPGGRLNNILAWAHKNKAFQINVWLDSEGDQINSIFGEHFSAAVENTKQLLNSMTQEIISCNSLNISNITIKEINDLKNTISELPQEEFYWEWIRHEIDKLRPNYGTASDLLRLAILERYGGAYYDSDVEAIDLCSRTSDEIWSNSITSLYLYNLSSNDIIICSPKDPLLGKWRQQVILNQKAKSKSFMQQMYDTYLSDSPFYITLNTMRTTGPSTIMLLSEIEREKIIKNTKLRKTATIESEQSWCNRKLKQLEENSETNIKKLQEYLLKTIKFEIESSGILRLEDHVDNFIKSVGHANEIEKSNLEPTFISKIEEFLKREGAYYLKQVIYVQCTFEHDLVFQFYSENYLLNKTCLLPWNLRVIEDEQSKDFKSNDYFRKAIKILSEISYTVPSYSNLDKFTNQIKICMKYVANIKKPNKECMEEKSYKEQCLKLEELQNLQREIQRQMIQNAWLDNDLIIKFSINYIAYIDNNINIKNVLAEFKKTIIFRENFILKYIKQTQQELNMQLLLQDLKKCSESNQILLSNIDSLLKIDKDKIHEFCISLKKQEEKEEDSRIWEYSSSDEEKEDSSFRQVKSFLESFKTPMYYSKKKLGCD